jgi:hypothetical protein
MKCPICETRNIRVLVTGVRTIGIVRKRECEIGHRFITLETVIDLSQPDSSKDSASIPLPKLWAK